MQESGIADEGADGDDDSGAATARTRFITVCVDNNLVPEPVIIRKMKTQTLDLAHYGLGDPYVSRRFISPCMCVCASGCRDHRVIHAGCHPPRDPLVTAEW